MLEIGQYDEIVGGRAVTVKIERDETMRAPWEEHDGHGPVSNWKPLETKKPGEIVLCNEKGSCRFYDWEEAIKLAKKDGWGLGLNDHMKLLGELRRVPTARQEREQAVRNDFDHIQGWCNDEWEWVYIEVTDDDTGVSRSLGGIYSFHKERIGDLVEDMIQEIIEKTLAA